MNANRSANDIFRLEHEVVTQYCISMDWKIKIRL